MRGTAATDSAARAATKTNAPKASAADQEGAKGAHKAASQFYDRGDYEKAIRYWTDAYGFDCNAHGVLGAEILLRWMHPTHGLVLPDQFISIAEESGLIVPIGEWVLQTACEQLKAWESDPRTEGLLLSVNVSARQFRQADFVAMVSRVLKQTGVNPQRLKLELTESLVLHNIVDIVAKMKALNGHGIHFSMDDFGTGYSSLAHLTTLPIQQLKIDRSFVRNIASNRNDAIIVQTIIGMANNLGVAVIAEGVEDEEQRACLERFGCPSYQGYLCGKPMPLPEFEALAMRVITV